MIKKTNKFGSNFPALTLLIIGLCLNLNAQTGDIIPTVCSTATYTLSSNSTIHFYDDGGPGGNCASGGAVGDGNFANGNCETITTICSAPGESLSVEFLVLSMIGTSSGFDWMVIYDGPNTSGSILFDNRSGGPDNPIGTSCNYNISTLGFCVSSGCLTFEFHASGAVNRAGWDAVVTSIPTSSSTSIIDIEDPTCTADGYATILNYDSNITYTFTPAGPSVNASGEIINANFGQNYTVEIGAGSCISATFQVEGQLSSSTISTPVVMCGNGDTQTLIGDPVGGTWSSSNTAVATIDGSGVVSSIGAGITTITYDFNGCTQTVDITVDVEVIPTFNAVPDFCENTTSPVLPTTSTNGINGVWSPATVSNLPGLTTYTYTPDNGVCATNQTMDITVEPNPVFTVSGNSPSSCNLTDGFVTIAGLIPNTSYLIAYLDENGNPVGPLNLISDAAGNAVVSNLANGSYSNFTVDLNGCVGTDAGTITLISPDIPTVDAGQDDQICEGESIVLSANNPDGAVISWDNGVVDGVVFTPSIGTITYTATADLAGCISTDVVTVEVNPTPVVNAGNDISVCEGEQVTLSGTGAPIYTWDNGVVDGQAFTPLIGTQVYTVTGSNAFGCESTDQITVIVSNVFDVTITADKTQGCTPLTVNFTNLSASTGTCTYTLSNGTVLNSCNPTYTFVQPGCYDVTLTVENSFGCSGSVTETSFICVDALPTASFTANFLVIGGFIDEVVFTNTSVGGDSFEWLFGDEEISTETQATHKYDLEETSYTVTLIATSNLGCTDTTSLVILVEEPLIYFIPNTFTPDGNNVNQTFKPIFTSGFDPLDYHLTIFNRWGEKVFESYDANFGWDGTYGMDGYGLVKEGTYVYTIDFKRNNNDKRVEVSGHVNLLR